MDIDYLRRVVSIGNTIPVIGSGVATAVAELPSWAGLVEAGLEFGGQLPPHPARSPEKFEEIRALAAGGPSGILPALSKLQELLAPGVRIPADALDYQAFLTEVFHEPRVKDARLLTALRGLAPRVVLTTNYDTLLDGAVTPGGESVTWESPQRIRSLLRGGHGVVHLHGRYDVPRSVILSQEDYDRLVREDDVRQVALAAFHAGVLIFIGVSIEGVNDPHLGQLLNEFAALTDAAEGEQYPHVILVKGRPTAHEIAGLRNLGIIPISYGDDHDDLPGFLDSLGDREETVGVASVREQLGTIAHATSIGEVVGIAADFIKTQIFSGRRVRVGYAERETAGDGTEHLVSRYVFPPNATHNVFNYPISIAAWALVEGSILAWPHDSDRRCDFARLRRLGRYSRVRELALAVATTEEPELAEYLDMGVVRERFETETLALGDFFQDWVAAQPSPHYAQFLSVPVPVVDRFGNRVRVPQYGVFNIDTLETTPLLDRRTAALLRLASDVVNVAYERFAGA